MNESEKAVMQQALDAQEETMRWMVKNVHKWDFPQYDSLANSAVSLRAAIAQPEQPTPRK